MLFPPWTPDFDFALFITPHEGRHVKAPCCGTGVRRKRGNQRMVCSGCGRRVREIVAVYEWEVRDLPCFDCQATVVVELHRIRCPDCRKPPLRQMGVDELYQGKRDKLLTVVCNLVWEPFRLSIEQWAPQCKIVYDKFHVLQHVIRAIDELRRAEFFRKGARMRGLIKGKRWLLLSRWKNLTTQHRGELNRLFQLNRRVFKAYPLKESLERLWAYRDGGAMSNYLKNWMDQLKWQRLRPFEKLAEMLLKHLEGILNYCRTKVRLDGDHE